MLQCSYDYYYFFFFLDKVKLETGGNMRDFCDSVIMTLSFDNLKSVS